MRAIILRGFNKTKAMLCMPPGTELQGCELFLLGIPRIVFLSMLTPQRTQNLALPSPVLQPSGCPCRIGGNTMSLPCKPSLINRVTFGLGSRWAIPWYFQPRRAVSMPHIRMMVWVCSAARFNRSVRQVKKQSGVQSLCRPIVGTLCAN